MDRIQREELDEMFGNSEDEYEVDDDGEGDEEEEEKEDEREADVEIDVDVDVDARADAAAVFDAVSALEKERSFDDMEGNAPDVAAYEHATDKGDLPTGKSEKCTEDKKASSMVCTTRIKVYSAQLIFHASSGPS